MNNVQVQGRGVLVTFSNKPRQSSSGDPKDFYSRVLLRPASPVDNPSIHNAIMVLRSQYGDVANGREKGRSMIFDFYDMRDARKVVAASGKISIDGATWYAEPVYDPVEDSFPPIYPPPGPPGAPMYPPQYGQQPPPMPYPGQYPPPQYGAPQSPPGAPQYGAPQAPPGAPQYGAPQSPPGLGQPAIPGQAPPMPPQYQQPYGQYSVPGYQMPPAKPDPPANPQSLISALSMAMK